MAVYRLDLAYDGSGFRGWARQEGQRTVQGELEAALATLLKSPVDTSVAGRTDAGVHALGQVVSFEAADSAVDARRLVRGLNGMLGPEVSAIRLVEMPGGFDARFSATWRRYRYSIGMGPANPLTRGFVWHVGRSLDMGAMRESAGFFVGEHDFSSFCRSLEGKSNVRRVTELLLEEGEDLLSVWVRANAFCHQMVRSVVGHLYDVGRGFTSPSDTPDVVAARDRSRVATVAPPHGLTLMEVGY